MEPETRISNKFPGDGDAADQEVTFDNQGHRRSQSDMNEWESGGGGHYVLC